MRYLSSMAISVSRSQQPACAAMAGADVIVTSAGGWCSPRFHTDHKTALDSTGKAKLWIFRVFRGNLVLVTVWSVTLWGCS